MSKGALAVLGLVLCLPPSWAQCLEEKKATVVFLQKLQAPDGGFLAAPPGSAPGPDSRSSLRATTAALRALKFFGGAPPDRAGCRRFVQLCFNPATGAFVDHPGSPSKPDVATTAVGLMALVELEIPLDRFRQRAVDFLAEHAAAFEEIRIAAAGLEVVKARPAQAAEWIEALKRMQAPDRTFGTGDGKARATAGGVVTLLRLGAQVEHPEDVATAIRAGQRADGGFGQAGAAESDLESGYRVLRALAMLRTKPADVAKCSAFIARCRNPDGGYGVAPGKPSSVAATYYAASMLRWLE
jgi:prenyltransferase beta subunit